MPNLWLVFTTGLVAGGVTCMAVQGGLLATAITQSENRSKFAATAGFLAGKLVIYTLLGFLLGILGAAFQLTGIMKAVFQGAVALYMLGVGLALLDVHPFFRRFVIQTPRFLTRMIRNQSRSKFKSKTAAMFGPVTLGLMTVFIPCGTTQAMMALAMATGNPWGGAVVMAVFVLGTSPMFAGLGLVMEKLGEMFKEKFRKAAAWLVAGMAIFSFNSALVLAGSPVSAQKILKQAECAISLCRDTVAGDAVAAADQVTITFARNKYLVDNPVVRAGSQIKLNLVNKEGYGCIQAFEFPKLGISQVVPPGESKSFDVDIPSGTGGLAFSCGMGMYTGQLTVIN
ncbi:MAG: putative membrane protein [Candidatus Amesbacteria bacterium GW2011_GWB1_47_19]|nr:MAG: putative membrane protein [Candidatus Amesbacteria bacterium GW2011_GWA1_44_24]KKU31635.1 MAG: putative membrane protein [Candidatus Amesbacteria bacterium GW2011_GWC1_46_24]KKU67408.1 MAG: putative membrane protein [Candidatus Amesbacteria bacterium GW2011_GWB1_47_19]OGD05374.1 MAG: hypothetical protein A2379_05345 [Candidatus Amesbacteria bacterium RIFOXYB1_FULL_47_13]